MVSDILPRKNFKCQGQYGKIKGQIKVTQKRYTPTTPNQCPYQYRLPAPLGFKDIADTKILYVSLFIYLGFYIAFNTEQVISRRVVGRAEEIST